MLLIDKTLKNIESKLLNKEIKIEDIKENSNTSLSFIPHQIEGDLNLGNKEIINELEKRLEKLNIKNINTLNQPSTDESDNSENEIDIEELAHQFTNKEQDINKLTNEFSKLNKIKTKNPFKGNPKPTIRNY